MLLNIIIYLFVVLFLLVLLVGLIGLLLPKQRVVSRQSEYDVSPEIVYRVVINNDDYAYRTGVKELRILERDGDFEVWEETSYKGNKIVFRTKEKIPYTFYSFDMGNESFTGYWTAEFKETRDGETLFIATEYIRIKNPYMKVLSYPFFDIGGSMERYQNDLKAKLKQYSKKRI